MSPSVTPLQHKHSSAGSPSCDRDIPPMSQSSNFPRLGRFTDLREHSQHVRKRHSRLKTLFLYDDST